MKYCGFAIIKFTSATDHQEINTKIKARGIGVTFFELIGTDLLQ
jgi:hypothetical protein